MSLIDGGCSHQTTLLAGPRFFRRVQRPLESERFLSFKVRYRLSAFNLSMNYFPFSSSFCASSRSSSYSCKTVEYYQSIFQSFGSCGSALTVAPFNQASKQDVEALVDYIYANFGMDLHYILPFTGIPKTIEKLLGWTTNPSLNSESPTGTAKCSLTCCEFWGLSRTRKQVVILFVTRPT